MGGFDAVVVGSGMIGAACAYELARAGATVAIVERGHLTGGTTAAGEGNLLVSDKPPGAELDLARCSVDRWHGIAAEVDDGIEFEAKGGVIVAASPDDAAALSALAERQRQAGVDARPVAGDELRRLEPALADDLDSGMHYPEDAQVQPVLAVAALLHAARRLGATVLSATEVEGLERDASGRVTAVRTSGGTLSAGRVVNAAGPWSGGVAALAGVDLPVRPRRGHVLVTEPRPPMIRHKVYEASYLDTLTSDPGGAQVSSVVEGTRGGTILLGSSREFVGFDRRLDVDVVRRIARRAVRLFPGLASVQLLRAYVGFRPYVPDHLPVIGEDPRAPGLVHATGHEGAGIGLAAGTGLLVAALVTGRPTPIDAGPFRVDRPGLHAGRRAGEEVRDHG